MGLGAVGSAAAWRLAAMGHEVIGFDSFDPPHSHGSTHAESRLTRETAWEGAEYVPLVRRANALWRELEREVGESFFVRNGALILAPESSHFIAATLESATTAGVRHELLDGAEVRRRWPHVEPSAAMVGLFDPGAGVLFPESVVRAEQVLARSMGATLRMEEAITGWRADGDGVVVRTRLNEYRADRLVICTGAWMYDVLRPLGVELRIERTTLHWYAARPHGPAMDARHAPVHVISEDGVQATVVFPVINGTIKAAAHGTGDYTTPEDLDRAIREKDTSPTTSIVRRHFPRSAGTWVKGATCMYTISPHGQFILDRHPDHPQVVLGSPCTGFGFKFSAATGEALACLAVGAPLPVPVDVWNLAAARRPLPPSDPSS